MKRFLSCLTALALAAALMVPMASAAYTDVPAGSALASEVQKAASYGLMNGYSAGIFGYSDSMTRAQFVAVLVRMMGWKTMVPEKASYYDVAPGSTWYEVIETAAAHDVTGTDPYFRPNTAITRGEMAELLVRALGLKAAAREAEKENALPFTDVSNRKGYITVAYEIGMTKGTSATAFSPNATATRAQAAAMLVRIYEKLNRKTD